MLSGVMEYRGGVSLSGDWIYEPNGAEHEQTHHPEETLHLANVHGAIAFVGETPAPARPDRSSGCRSGGWSGGRCRGSRRGVAAEPAQRFVAGTGRL